MPEAGDVPVEAFGACARDHCENPCPWDMAAIVFDGETVCCSPHCAEVVLEGRDATPSVVTYHDPQAAADREALGLGGDVVDIYREVDSKTEAEAAIREISELHPNRFRMSTIGGDDE